MLQMFDDEDRIIYAREIKRWVRDENNRKVGLLIAWKEVLPDGGEFASPPRIHIGFSFCNTKFDKFDKSTAILLAVEKSFHLVNARKVEPIMKHVPYDHRDKVFDFLYKCERYFKNFGEYPEWVRNMGFGKPE